MAGSLNAAAMRTVVTERALLFAHPDTPGESVWSIAAEVELTSASRLAFHYSLHGDMAHVTLPRARARRRADDLWKHTCFEAFLSVEGACGYFEFNFSPSLDWSAYHFAGYRSGMTCAQLTQAPGLQVRRTASQLELSATVHLTGLGSLGAAPLLRLALAAVIEEDAGRLSYWALQHPPGNPDFHHSDGFVLELRNA